MIELVTADNDDLEFLQLIRRIVNGAVAALGVHEVYLVHVDNWFDFKWLGWWSGWEHQETKTLYVPPFNPNRVRSETHFVWDVDHRQWPLTELRTPLHRRQPGRREAQKQSLDRWAKSAVFVWYSGNTASNGSGSMMLYLSGADGYAWYASFQKEGTWKVDDGFQIGRNELASFEECGRSVEATHV